MDCTDKYLKTPFRHLSEGIHWTFYCVQKSSSLIQKTSFQNDFCVNNGQIMLLCNTFSIFSLSHRRVRLYKLLRKLHFLPTAVNFFATDFVQYKSHIHSTSLNKKKLTFQPYRYFCER